MNRKNYIKEGEIVAFVDPALYTKETVLKCLYWFGDRFHTSLELEQKGSYQVSLKPMSSGNIKPDELELYLQKFERDLIDFQLRSIINDETRNIRDLLVAKAFSNGEFDEDPPGGISDPVGFNPIQ